MSQWGKPYMRIVWKGGRLLEQTMVPHYPSPTFAPVIPGTRPDMAVCVNEEHVTIEHAYKKTTAIRAANVD